VTTSSSQTAILAAPAPLAGRDTWEAVIAAAGYQCQCTRPHKSHRSAPDGRCEAAHGVAGVRLVAGPETPSHDPARTMAGADVGLSAWCGDCWDLEVRAAARRRRDEVKAALADGMEGLF
jgi:hypothetical protein